MGTPWVYENEPVSTWLDDDLKQFLIWAVENKCSDILLQPGTGIWIRIDGEWWQTTKRRLHTDEINILLDIISYDPSSSARLKGGEDIDFSYEIKLSRIERLRFRVNASACQDGYNSGATMVLRTIPSLPPKIEDLNVEPEILEAAFPNNGLVLVTGVMGTGKSTLLSSLLRHVRETQRRNIITYEAPIEFDLMGIPNPLGPLVQTQIPIHLQDFDRAPRNSARRAADIILVGESRDRETLKGMIESAEIGVCAYSTVHTRSVAETPSRIINVFPQDMQNQIASTLISGLRLIIQQRLLPKVGGGRVAVKEYLSFTNELRERLYKIPLNELIPAIQEMVDSHGQNLLVDATRKMEKGLIREVDYEAILKEKQK